MDADFSSRFSDDARMKFDVRFNLVANTVYYPILKWHSCSRGGGRRHVGATALVDGGLPRRITVGFAYRDEERALEWAEPATDKARTVRRSLPVSTGFSIPHRKAVGAKGTFSAKSITNVRQGLLSPPQKTLDNLGAHRRS